MTFFSSLTFPVSPRSLVLPRGHIFPLGNVYYRFSLRVFLVIFRSLARVQVQNFGEQSTWSLVQK